MGLPAFFLELSQLAFNGGVREQGEAHKRRGSRDHTDSNKIDDNVSHVVFRTNPQSNRSTGVPVSIAIFYLGRTVRHSCSPFVS